MIGEAGIKGEPVKSTHLSNCSCDVLFLFNIINRMYVVVYGKSNELYIIENLN